MNTEQEKLNNELFNASSLNDIDKMKELITKGAEHKQALVSACFSGNLKIVKFLVDNGADIHAGKNVSLLNACLKGHIHIIEYLVEKGADIHAQENAALISASSYGHLEIVKFLISKGANVHAQHDLAIRTAIQLGSFDVATYLITEKHIDPLFVLEESIKYKREKLKTWCENYIQANNLKETLEQQLVIDSDLKLKTIKKNKV